MKRLFLFVPILLTGCVTTSGGNDVTVTAEVAGTRNAQIADATARELEHLARFNPDQLDQVSVELLALAAALVHASHSPAEEPVGLLTPEELPPAPSGFEQAASLRHGIHLASYRIEANAVAGWSELQTEFPDQLAARSARLEIAEIAGQGRYLRLKAGPYDTVSDARAACAAITARGAYCQTVDFSGANLLASE